MRFRLTTTDRRIVSLAIPAFGALAAEPFYRLVDTAIVGRLGTQELGGVAVAVSVLTVVIAGSNFLAYGTTERVARRLGAAQPAEAASVGVQALWLAAVVSAIAVPTLVVGAETWCRLLGADDDVLRFGVEYLRVSAVGVPFVLVGLAAQGTQRGATDYRPALVILVAANALNVALEPWFVFGLDGGVAGAAWATVISQAFAGTALLVRTRRHLVAATRRTPAWTRMAPLLSAGRHLLLRVASMLVVFTGSTAVAARIDDATLAAHQVAMSMFLFLALSLDALAVPTQTLVADALGAGSDAAHVAARALRLSVVIGGGLAVVVAATSPLLSRVFSDDPAVIARATAALALLGVVLLPGAVAFATDGSLIGAGDYRFLGRAALVYLAGVIPIAALTLAVPALGIAGVWTGLGIWMTMRAVVNRHRARSVLRHVVSPACT